MLKEKLLRELKRNLNESDQQLFKLFTTIEQKGKVIVRIPKTFFTLDNLWMEIQSVADKNKIPLVKAGLYATVLELDDILTDIKWLWKNNIPRGFMTMIAGEPGIGKSLVGLDFAKTVTNGITFPASQETCKAGSVLWIDTEMKQQLLNVRSKSIGMDRSKLLIPSIKGNLLTKFDASDNEHKEHIINIVEEKCPDLMVVDSLGHSHSRGENKIEEVRPVMDFLTALARDNEMGLLVIHHLNKGNNQESTEVSMTRVRGSTDIVATPVVIFAIEKNTEDSIKIRQIKNNIGRQQPALSASLKYHDTEKEEISSLYYELYAPPPPKRNKKETCADWIYKILQDNQEGMDLKDILDMGVGVGYTRGNIYGAKDVLGDQMMVTGTGNHAVWHLSKRVDENALEQIKRSKRNGK